MLGCYFVRGSLAASAYDELAEREQERLDRHLRRCAKCRERAASFRKLAQAPRTPAPEPGLDLVSLARRRLNERSVWAHTPSNSPPLRGRLPVFAAAAALAVGAFGLAASGLLTLPEGDSALDRPGFEQAEDASGQPGILQESAALAANHDYAGAYRALDNYLTDTDQANDELSGPVLLAMADLAYEKLQWFDRAHEAYELVVRHNRELLEERDRMAEVVLRWNVLAEARKVDYASVHALFAARDSARGAFDELQGVVAQYPGTFVASQAVREMAAAVEDTPGEPIEALAAARNHVTDPIVQAQIDLELGYAYLNTREDTARARQHFLAASECRNSEVAQRANASLASLRERAEP